MNGDERRQTILEILQNNGDPVSAGSLAARFAVSRQIIVGDVALLRAGGADISATPRGYVMTQAAPGLLRRIPCRHDGAGMEAELNAVVDQGCSVLDVIVDHPIYGQLTGPLQLSSRYDIRRPSPLGSHWRHTPAHPLLPERGGVSAGPDGPPDAGRLIGMCRIAEWR